MNQMFEKYSNMKLIVWVCEENSISVKCIWRFSKIKANIEEISMLSMYQKFV